MADIPLQFADIGNALAQGYHVRALREQSQESDRRKALAPDVQAAISGDAAALGRVAGADPDYALKIGPILDRLDANKQAVLKRAADFTTQMGMGVLNATPDQQAAAYEAGKIEAQRQGHDISKWPQQWSPQAKAWVEFNVNKAVPVTEWFKQREGQPQPMGAVGGGGAAAPAGAPSPNREQFINTMTPHALEVSKATGLDPRLVLAQSALETGYGAGAPGNNYFGIKSHGAPGGQTLATQEAGPGGMVPAQESFRTYADPGASAADYAQFLKTNSRYAPVLAAQGLDAQIEAMGRSGYATDPNYAAKLRQIAQSLPPVQMPGPPPGLVPNGPPMAQMPGAPQGLIPPGPPPAPMPQVGGPPSRGVPGPIAQGDTPQADGSGTPLPPQAAPPPPSPKDLQQFVPPGWRMMGHKGMPAYDHLGRLMVQKPDGTTTSIEIPKTPETQFGWQRGPGGLTPERGGPHDPEYQRQAAEAKRKAEEGGVPGPFSPKSVEGSALNTLIADGTLTQNQAAQLATGKTITNPADGSVIFMTPEGLFKKPPGGPSVPVQQTAPAGAPAPAAAPAAAENPGMITVTPPKPQTPNNEQARDAGFSDRMANSNGIVANIENQGKSSGGRFKEAIPFGLGNFAQSEDYQKFKQARDDFINAQLRRESGAAINADEYTKADKQYFPVPGDSQAVIDQKALNRKIAVEAMIKSAGPSYKPRAAEAPKGATLEDLKFKARKAIEQGADPAAVAKRLKDMGVEGGL